MSLAHLVLAAAVATSTATPPGLTPEETRLWKRAEMWKGRAGDELRKRVDCEGRLADTQAALTELPPVAARVAELPLVRTATTASRPAERGFDVMSFFGGAGLGAAVVAALFAAFSLAR